MMKESEARHTWSVHMSHMQSILSNPLPIGLNREVFLRRFIDSPVTRGSCAYIKDGYDVESKEELVRLWEDSKHGWAGIIGSTLDDLFPGSKIPIELKEFYLEVTKLNANMGHNRELLEFNMDEPPTAEEVRRWH